MTTSVTAATTAHLMPPRTHNIQNLDMGNRRDEFRSFCAIGLARNKSLSA
jgi:hypothetical protein